MYRLEIATAKVMPTYKLYYFNSRGLAEVPRWIFAQAGIEYEDIRVEKDQWPDMKPTMPFGTLPVLEVDGKRLSGSRVIARYLAEQYNLAGSNAFENAEVDSIADGITDFRTELGKALFEKDEKRKEELKKEFSEKTLPTALKRFNELASTGGYLWDNKVTWADFLLLTTLSYITSAHPETLDNYPALKKLQETVESLPNIAKWIKERPVTEF